MDIFNDTLNTKQANFLSRIIGIFSEDVVRFWLENKKCKYNFLGRPQVWTENDSKKYSLDYLLQDKKTKKCYIAEQKCFFGFKDGKLKKISEAETFSIVFDKWSNEKRNHTVAWARFIEFNNDSHVSIKNKKCDVSGKILVWASCDKKAKKDFQKKHNIFDVVSFEQVIRDLNKWEDRKYLGFLKDRKKWINQLFNSLTI